MKSNLILLMAAILLTGGHSQAQGTPPEEAAPQAPPTSSRRAASAFEVRSVTPVVRVEFDLSINAGNCILVENDYHQSCYIPVESIALPKGGQITAALGVVDPEMNQKIMANLPAVVTTARATSQLSIMVEIKPTNDDLSEFFRQSLEKGFLARFVYQGPPIGE